jgi:hypothetical protein
MREHLAMPFACGKSDTFLIKPSGMHLADSIYCSTDAFSGLGVRQMGIGLAGQLCEHRLH